ncbi:MAG: serine/threonine protein kinase [Phycisphaeraceae bacterium]|nr:serine/threonine protein kinase [Phycisphaeraceae bacterium]
MSERSEEDWNGLPVSRDEPPEEPVRAEYRPGDEGALTADAAGQLMEDVFSEDLDAPGLVLSASPRIGEYSIVRTIASGGMGTVYEARQENPHRSVALKVLKSNAMSPTNLRRFQSECAILGKLRHPAIATIFGAGVHRDEPTGSSLPYFAMELIPLARPITLYASDRGLELDRKLRLFLHVCDGVHHGNRQGVVHRDLKPANILVDDTGWPKIIDFGIAKTTDADVAATTSTDMGQVLGTIQYMSPEQCHGDPLMLDARADVYALGVVLYELVCGQLPYKVSELPVHQAMKVVTDEVPPRPRSVSRSISRDLDAIVMRSLEKDPSKRYQSVQDLAEDIRRCLAGHAVHASAGGAAGRLVREVFKRRALLPVVILGGLAVMLAVSLIVQVADVVRAGAVVAAMLLPAAGLGAAALGLRRERDELRAKQNHTGQLLAGERARRRGAENERASVEKELMALKRMTRRLLRDMDDALRQSRADPALRARLRKMIRERLVFKPGEAGKGHILAEPPTKTFAERIEERP